MKINYQGYEFSPVKRAGDNEKSWTWRIVRISAHLLLLQTRSSLITWIARTPLTARSVPELVFSDLLTHFDVQGLSCTQTYTGQRFNKEFASHRKYSKPTSLIWLSVPYVFYNFYLFYQSITKWNFFLMEIKKHLVKKAKRRTWNI